MPCRQLPWAGGRRAWGKHRHRVAADQTVKMAAGIRRIALAKAEAATQAATQAAMEAATEAATEAAMEAAMDDC